MRALKCAMLCLAFCGVGARADDSLLLRQNLTVEGIRTHQRALQDIADANNGNRMAGSSGYRHSVSYVAAQMREAGYQVRLQDFNVRVSDDQAVPLLRQKGPQEHSFVAGQDFLSMSFSGNVETIARIEAVDLKIPSQGANHSSSGCEAQDFKGFTWGSIALIQRGTCAFAKKVELAKAAGASGVIIFNEGNPDRLEVIQSRLGQSSANFPVLGASFAVGERLSGGVLKGFTGNSAHIRINVSNNLKVVQNVIADGTQGNANKVIVIGAHLDSVQAGPGMNDNGSGSATILQIAKLIASLNLVQKNQLRFIWFGAEEMGLLGSEHYVDSLSSLEKQNILAMLNFDMLGSPNYARFVYDGDNSRLTTNSVSGPGGSGYIERIFLDYFASQGLATHPTAFDGRSDYGPFILAGIPAGGLFSGAESRKSARLAEIYGGEAGVPFDICYHKRCDNFQNTEGLALKSLAELSQGAAHAVVSLANTEQNIRLPQGEIRAQPEVWEYKGHLMIK